MDNINLEKNNISIEEKINSIKENEKFKLEKRKNLDEMIHLESEKELKRIELLNKSLDEEITYVYSKIDSANRKWILDDFEKYLYKNQENYICTRIYHHKYAKELRCRLKKFKNSDKDKNNKIAVIDKLDYRSARIDKDLDENKVETLLKSWIFFSNTTVDYSKTIAFPTDFNKSIMYKIKMSGIMFIGISISIAAFIAIVGVLAFSSEGELGSFGFDEIFIFNMGGNSRRRRRRRNRNRAENSYEKKGNRGGLTKWFDNMKENFLY